MSSNKTQQYMQYNNKPKLTNNNNINIYIMRYDIEVSFSDTVLFSNSNVVKNWRYYSYYKHSKIHNNTISISFVFKEDNFDLLIEVVYMNTKRNICGYILIPSPSRGGVFSWTANHTDTKTNNKNEHGNGNQKKTRISEINHLSLNIIYFFSYFGS